MYKIEAQPYCRQLKAELNQVGRKVEGLNNINGVAGSCVYFNSEASAQRPYLRILQSIGKDRIIKCEIQNDIYNIFLLMR